VAVNKEREREGKVTFYIIKENGQEIIMKKKGEGRGRGRRISGF
jgi:hypothetical protein